MITDAELLQTRKEIYLGMLAKSGVLEWVDTETNEQIWLAAVDAADGLLGITGEIDNMAVTTNYITTGTALVVRNTGGDYAITLASLANGNGTSTGARQCVTIDLGASWARRWRIDSELEIAATPTAGNTIDFHGSFGNATGAGKGNTSGTDAAYTGYSNNIDNALKHLIHLGSHVCTAQATTTVQKGCGDTFSPSGRYLNLVVNNKSGAALHSTETNQLIRLTPLPDTSGN